MVTLEKLITDKKIQIGAIATLAVIALLFTSLVDIILTFLLAGLIPGTHIIVPYWFMMAIYCGLISYIATPYIERFLIKRHNKRNRIATTKQPRSRRPLTITRV